jgi:hypothetical protein
LPVLQDNEIDVPIGRQPLAGSDIETTFLGKYPRLEWLLPVLFCAVMLAQLILSSRHLSQTADEATHLYAGYRYLKCADLTVSPEHPPFAKIIAALPLLAMNVSVDCVPFKGDALHQALTSSNWFYAQDWPVVLARARAATAMFCVGLCLFVWIGARRMFGFNTAVVASLLLVFEPNVLAYGSLVMTDIPVACLMVLAVLGFYFFVKYRTVPFLALTVIATGLALVTKHSGVILLPILATLAIADAITPKTNWLLVRRNLLSVVLIFALTVPIVWAAYGLRFAISGALEATDSWPPTGSVVGHVLVSLERYHLLPQAYLRGFAEALALASHNSVAFVAGRIYTQAPWFSTLFNFAIRNTAAMLGLLVAGAFGLTLSFRERRRERLFIVIPAIVFLAVCLHASGNVSIRYLLPIFPFLLVGVADGCVQLTKRVKWAAPVVLTLILLHAASSLHAYPNYLSYANDLWGGPSEAYKYLPWNDIGQAYPEARAFLEHRRPSSCWLISAWQWDPAIYDLPCNTSGLYSYNPIPAHIHGTVIISSTLLTDVRLPEQQLVAAFRYAKPTDRIGGSALLVYEGDFDTSLNAAIVDRNLAASAFSSGRSEDALAHSERELQLAPGSALAHGDHCMFLAGTNLQSALNECSATRELLLRDPLRDEEGRRKYLESLDLALVTLRHKYRIVYGKEPEIAPYPPTQR